jgi:hypothetical protein
MTSTENQPIHWGDIDGVSIDFPMVVESMNQATLSFTVPIEPARALIPGDAFEVMETAPGSATFVVALVDYVENPWGDYNEINLGLLAQPVGQPERAGVFVYRMPVDQEFTMKAGNQVLGLPKTVEDLTFDYTDDEVVVTLRTGDAPLTVRLPRPRGEDPASSTEAITYSYLDGAPTELPLTIEIGSGLIDPADIVIELGSSTIADELASLGLPCAPDFAVWGEGLSGSFEVPRPL